MGWGCLGTYLTWQRYCGSYRLLELENWEVVVVVVVVVVIQAEVIHIAIYMEVSQSVSTSFCILLD